MTTPHGPLNLAAASKATIGKHCKHAWELAMSQKDNRTAGHAFDTSLLEPHVQKHMEWIGSSYAKRQIAMGACPDHRLINSMFKYEELACDCGQINPTRRHWGWRCTSRPTRSQPQSDMDEGLGIRWIPRQNKHMHLADQCNRRLRDWIANTEGEQPVVCATDGSSMDQSAAGWAATFEKNGQDILAGGKVSGADQSSYAAELEALYQAIMACEGQRRLAVHIFIDNKAVLEQLVLTTEAISTKKEVVLPRYSFARWSSMAKTIKDSEIKVTAEHVPSHGKRMDSWMPERYDALLARRLNDREDIEAQRGATSQQLRYEEGMRSQAIASAERCTENMFRRQYDGLLSLFALNPELGHQFRAYVECED